MDVENTGTLNLQSLKSLFPDNTDEELTAMLEEVEKNIQFFIFSYLGKNTFALPRPFLLNQKGMLLIVYSRERL